MVKIRLRRTGCNNNVSFRVVAADERSPRDGKFLEIIGWYDPKREGENFKLDLDRVAHWQSKGAAVERYGGEHGQEGQEERRRRAGVTVSGRPWTLP